MSDDGRADVVIELAGVGQTFTSAGGARVTALADVDLTLKRHEFVSIIGPSGCGKSTILRLVGGLIRPTAGAVAIFGLPVTEPRDEIGIVFQRPTLLPWLNVLDNITFPMKHKYGRVDERDRARAHELLQMIGLADFGARRPAERGGGTRGGLPAPPPRPPAPDTLLAAEPFSALDALTRDEMSFELLRIWSERPKTVVFVTHSIPEALLLSDRIVVMSPRPGRVSRLIDVPLARPRSAATLADPELHRLADDIRRSVFSRAAQAP